MIRVVIADDQFLFADNLKIMLEGLTDDIRVVGIAKDGLEAVQMARELFPDIILMDIRMPNLSGVEATKQILEENPGSKIIIMTTFDEEDYVTETLNSGAAGYLLKDLKSHDLITALYAVHNGTILLSPQVMKQLLRYAASFSDENREAYKTLYDSLTKREREVLAKLADGCSNRRIAKELFLSEATVRNYISFLYTKMGTNDRMEVIAYAKKIVSAVSKN